MPVARAIRVRAATGESPSASIRKAQTSASPYTPLRTFLRHDPSLSNGVATEGQSSVRERAFALLPWMCVLSLAAVLRLVGLNAHSYWLDEILDVLYGAIPLGSNPGSTAGRRLRYIIQNNPPLDYILRKAVEIAGPTDAARRAVGVVWGVGCVAALGALVARAGLAAGPGSSLLFVSRWRPSTSAILRRFGHTVWRFFSSAWRSFLSTYISRRPTALRIGSLRSRRRSRRRTPFSSRLLFLPWPAERCWPRTDSPAPPTSPRLGPAIPDLQPGAGTRSDARLYPWLPVLVRAVRRRRLPFPLLHH